MSVVDLFLTQFADPFRIGLLAALVLTMVQTSAHTGRMIPLAAGVVFVAVLIPTTMGSDQGDRMTAIVVGIVANVVILAIILGLVALWQRFSGTNHPPR